jgi:AcrR family transcriptional regulator
MARWQPDAVGRLRAAALELYDERGYDDTTVADIAARAGLTERTYFRHFADKREVLFYGGEELREQLATGVEQAPPEMGPLAAVVASVEAVAPFFDGRRAHSARRYRIIRANPELQERELAKTASLVDAVTVALRERQVPEAVAELTAEAGIAVFTHAFRRWVDDDVAERSYAEHVRETVAQLRQIAAETPALSAAVPT